MGRQEPVAIVGMAVNLPGAPDLAAYWNNLVAGRDSITAVPEGRWDESAHGPDGIYCRRGGFVDGVLEGFDPARHGMMPASVPGTDPDQLIALHTAAAALADAGGLADVDRARVGVVLGRGGYITPGLARFDQRVRTARQVVRTVGELLPGLGEEELRAVHEAFCTALGPDSPDSAVGLVPNFASSRIANRLDLGGPAYTVDAACASSLVALDQAVGELASGRCDLMLAGGVHHCHDITLWSVFSRLRALSASGRCRPFHRAADGVLMGEGTAVVALKRLTDAVRDGDRVYAVIRGVGVAGDGRAASLVNPDPSGQARAVRLAWESAGLDPAAPLSVGLLEAHGTGTPQGDAAELATLLDVFGRTDEPNAAIGSVKSMIGHTMPAAGAAALVKAALAVHHATLLPTLHCEEPHPDLLRTRFRPLDAARPWEAPVRRAAVNAFGFGGINAHVVLEQSPTGGRPAGRAVSRARVHEPEQVLRVSAATPERLRALLETDDTSVRNGVWPQDGPARLAVVAPTAKSLALARRVAALGHPWGGRSDVWFAPDPLIGPAPGAGGSGTRGGVAFLFPGLEAEFAPRVEDVAEHFGFTRPQGRDAVVGDVARHGLAVVGVGRMLDAALRRAAITPDAVAGHSVGEWTAMTAGGMFDGTEVDALLGRFDPASLRVPDVAFAWFGTSADDLGAVLTAFPGVVLSHDNAPRQSVACGPEQQIHALVAHLRSQGFLGDVLPFRSGFHTPMLAPYLGPLEEGFRQLTLRRPRVPVWSGTTATPFPGTEADVRVLVVRHLLEPVRFRQLTEGLYAAGIRAFVQLGSGQLPTLVGSTLGDRPHLAVTMSSSKRPGMAQFRRAAAGLWAFGAEPDVSVLDAGTGAPGDLAVAAGRGGSTTTRLDLSTGPVVLDTRVRDRLRALVHDAAGGTKTGLGTLAEAAARHPEAAQLQALLTETAEAAAALYAAAAPAEPGVPAPAPAASLRVALDTMPYLTDHCFFRQRPGWPDVADRWPVVPATTMLDHMLAAVPGIPVAVRDARFLKWAVAEPPMEISVTVTPRSGGVFHAEFGPHARAEVERANAYPRPPARWPEPVAERPVEVTAREMYERHWMFHGPRFQGVTEITSLGDRHVRATFTTPPAPGALLDNVGQLLGYWLIATHTDQTVVFPAAVEEMVFHGPHPAPGRTLTCHIRIVRLTETLLEADVQLADPDSGVVWCQIKGWQDRRFASRAATDHARRHPETTPLAERQDGGWHLLFEHWGDLATRELMMRGHLGGDERAEYEQRPPRGRRQWLLGRMAAKDAVRGRLWESAEGPVFPAEVRILNKASGEPFPIGAHGRGLPPLDLSLAHCQEAAVAIARPSREGHGTGIDIEEISERPSATHDVVLAVAERPLFERLGGGAALLTRFWAAKEAVAKAETTGLRGRPHDFTVVRAEQPDRWMVRAPSGRTHEVCLTEVVNPPGLPHRRYVVAWTSPPPATPDTAPPPPNPRP